MLKMSQRIRSTLLILISAAQDGLRFLRQMACSRSALAAENLFLRKQLAFYQEHKIRPSRLSNAARFSLLLWSRLFDWRAALAIVKPDTFFAGSEKLTNGSGSGSRESAGRDCPRTFA